MADIGVIYYLAIYDLVICFIDMRVTENEFVAEPVADIGYIKVVRLGAHLGIENNVQEHVSEFLGDLRHVVAGDGGRQFERLLDGVLAEGVESLFAVPRAFLPEVVHDIQKPSESG